MMVKAIAIDDLQKKKGLARHVQKCMAKFVKIVDSFKLSLLRQI